MPYRLKSPISPREGVIRIAREQIARALDEIDQEDLGAEETIHQVRKRCKKLRGLLRLVRPALGDRYSRENARFRDIARDLSVQRDADVLLDTHDELVSNGVDDGDSVGLTGVRSLLQERADRAETRPVRELLTQARVALHEAEADLEDWLDEQTLSIGDLSGGLKKTYRRGRKGMHRAYETDRGEDFHEWRKRAKYHFYHLRLLEDLWGPVVKARRRQAKRLSDLLGDEHDLSVYLETIGALNESSLDPQATAQLEKLALARRNELRAAARGLGERLWAEKPGRLADRIEAYWETWRAETLQGPGT
jgi:CHAD domain-containing protein